MSPAPPAHRPYRVMTVCTGNICRSPMAEEVLRARLADAGLGPDEVVVDSTGTSDEEEGNPIDRRAARALREAGYDVPDHRARPVRAEQLAERDLVLAMTARHARLLRTLAPDADAASRVAMYRSFDPDAPATDGPGALADEAALDIDDPWYGGQRDFEVALAQVEAGADGVVEHVRAALAERAGRAGRAAPSGSGAAG